MTDPQTAPALEIRLQRITTRRLPTFRVVVCAAEQKDGRFLEQLGTYDPAKRQGDCQVDRARLAYWLDLGAQPVGDARAMLTRLETPQPAAG